MIRDNAAGFFPTTPAINLLYGLREAVQMLDEEGLANVFARHAPIRARRRDARSRRGGSSCCARSRRNTATR